MSRGFKVFMGLVSSRGRVIACTAAFAQSALSACGTEFADCSSTRSCAGDMRDSGAAGTLNSSAVSSPTGTGGAGAGSQSAPEETGGRGAEEGTGDTDAGPAPEPAAGAPCSAVGALACAGTAQKVVLFCDGSSWTEHETCDSEENCDGASPSCAAILPECQDRLPGDRGCLEHQAYVCGPDLVSAEREDCEGLCSEGVCQPPVCGDERVQSSLGETCDDGNDVDTDECPGTCEAAACGDGFVWEGVEVCDPGAAADCHARCNWIWGVAEGPCALQRVTGAVKCWGPNDWGRLGLGDKVPRGDLPGQMGADLPAVDLGTGRSAVHLSTRFGHTCAVLDDQSLKCWGGNSEGELGLGHVFHMGDHPLEMGDHLPAVDLGTTPAKPTRVAVGASHTCALFNTGQIKCWGSNWSGQLGLGDMESRGTEPGTMGDSLPFVTFGLHTEATDIVAHTDFTCARFTNGRVRCWGENWSGQLGYGDQNNRGDKASTMSATVDLGSGVTVQQLAAGYEHVCALLTGGAVKCWGSNWVGQLGQGDANERGTGANQMGDYLPPVDLGTGEIAIQVAAGYYHSCALLERGAIKCWGENWSGQLGVGLAVPSLGKSPGEMGDALPAVDLGGKKAVHVTAHDFSTCARLEDGSLRCWGANVLDYAGALGLGDNVDRGRDPADMGENLPEVKLD
jgi:hypothetical protein